MMSSTMMNGVMLDSMMYWHWLALGIVLLILDVAVAGSSFLMWIGFAGLATGLVTFILPIGWQIQFVVFGASSVASVLVWHRYVKDVPVQGGAVLNQRGAEHIGRVVALEEAIVGGMGRIRLDDTLWNVQGPDLPAGSRVKLVRQDGNLFVVQIAE